MSTRPDGAVPRASTILGSTDRHVAARSLRRLLVRSGRPARLEVSEHPRSGRNRLFLVSDDERTWLAKATLTETESWFYDHVGRHVSWVPDFLGVGDPTVVVTEYLDRHPSLLDLGREDPRAALAGLVSLAPALAQLHGWPLTEDAPVARPSLPELDPVHVAWWIDGSEPSRHVLRSLQKRELLGRVLREAGAGVGPEGLVHGDLKVDNVLSAPTGPLVIDWELSGRGPVAWDLGSIVGSMVALWIEGVNLEADGPDAWFDEAVMPYPVVCDAARQFFSDYRRHAGAGPAGPRLAAVVSYAVAWLIGRSWADSLLTRQVNPRHLLRLVIAEGLARNPQAFFRESL